MPLISISYNGHPKQIDANSTVEQLLKDNLSSTEDIAIAINTTFIPRESYPQHIINDGDVIDIVSPIQGG
jgi:sulfur carrier protein